MDPGCDDIDGHRYRADGHGCRWINRAIGSQLDDDTEAFELENKIRDHRNQADHGADDAQNSALVFAREEVRLTEKFMLFGKLPDRRQKPVGRHESEAGVGHYVKNRSTLSVSESAGAKKRESCVNFACKQNEHKQGPEAPSAH